MRKEDLDRRNDELKARMLEERNQAPQKKPSSVGNKGVSLTGEAVRQSRKSYWRDQIH